MRGSVFDVIDIPIALLGFGIAFVLVAVIIGSLQGTVLDTDSDGTITKGVAAMNAFDQMFIFALGILSVTAIIAAALINSHPIFLPINLIVLVILCFFGFSISNVWEGIIGVSPISIIAANYPYTTLFFSNLMAYMVLEGGIILLVMHTKTQGSAGGVMQGGGGMF